MSDMETIAGLLQDLLDEVRAMRQDFNEFSNYGVQNMKATVEDIAGPTHYNLQDIHGVLSEVARTLSFIESNTST